MKIYVLEYDFDSTPFYKNGYKEHRKALFEENNIWKFHESVTYAKERPSICKNIVVKEYVVQEINELKLEDIPYTTYG